MKKAFKLCVIGGDGIGPEVTQESIRILDQTGIPYSRTDAYAGFSAYQKFGTPLPDETVKICTNSDAVLFGAVTSPPNIPGYFSPIVKLRKLLNLYANVRPFKTLPGSDAQKDIDIVIIRENTEDLYMGREYETPEGAIAERVITKKACEDIVHFACNLALEQKRKKITAIHKANVLRITDGLFLRIAQEVCAQYPTLEFNEMLVDSCALQLIKKPETFDVIVTTNMFGDILSDEVAGLTGGLGIASSANIGNAHALFEPVHGSAPKYVGTNTVNPIASFFSLCMLLEHLGYISDALKIRMAITATVASGFRTKDLGGTSSMSEFTDKVLITLQTL